MSMSKSVVCPPLGKDESCASADRGVTATASPIIADADGALALARTRLPSEDGASSSSVARGTRITVGVLIVAPAEAVGECMRRSGGKNGDDGEELAFALLICGSLLRSFGRCAGLDLNGVTEVTGDDHR